MHKPHTESFNDALSVDFSAEATKKREIKQALLRQLVEMQNAAATQKEDFPMNQTQKRRFKRSSVIAIAACLTLALSVSAFAFVHYLSLGENAIYIVNPRDAVNTDDVLPEELRGLLYDADGKLLEKFGDIQDAIYNADGEAVMVTSDDSGKLAIVTMEEEPAETEQVSTLFDALEDAQAHLAFDALVPSYVPSDYVLEGYRIFNDEDGKPAQDTKYLSIYYYGNNGVKDYIYIQARLMDEETSFASDVGSVEKTTINGHEAIIGRSNVDILIGDVMYMIHANKLPQSEVIKMAESLTK